MLSPLTGLGVALLLLLVGHLAGRRRLVLFAAALGVVSYAGTTPLAANLLVGWVERDARGEGTACPQVEAVVLLAGGLARPPRNAEDFSALSPRTLERVGGLVERSGWRGAPLVISGGGRHPISEARVIDGLLRRLAAPPHDWLLEEESQNTWENASGTRALLPDVRRVALATGALHLPRARRAFEAVGFEVCPWPVHVETLPLDRAWVFWPNSIATRKTEAGLHELIGGWYYRWLAYRAGSASSTS